MRLLIAYVFFAAAAYRAWIDWQATMGEGNAYRMASVEALWQQTSPGSYETWYPVLQSSTIPYLWDPVLMVFFGFPMALLLFVLGAFFWLIRRRKRR